MIESLHYAYPERRLKRARFIHLTFPGGAWSLCNRARVGDRIFNGKIPEGWDLCPRCLTRKKFIARGVAFRRRRLH